MFRIRFLLVFLCTILAANVAYSGFKTSRIGGTKGLVVTPVADLLTQLQSVLSDPNQQLTSQQLEDLNVDVSAFGDYPLDSHELSYIQALLSGLTFGNSQASFQSLFNSSLSDNASACPNSNCALGAADWQHENVATDTTSSDYDNWNLITASLIDDLLGESNYTQALLDAGGSSIADVIDTNSVFRSLVNNPIGSSQRPDITTVKNAIHEIAGFVGVFADDPLNPENSDYTDATQLVNAFFNNTDYGNFTLANFHSCYVNNESRSGGSNVCNVSAQQWDGELTALANFSTAKQSVIDNNTLTLATLQGIPVDLSGFSTPLEQWVADYITNQLRLTGTGESVSLTDWQSTINTIAANEGAAARWKIGQVATNAAGHSASDITNHLLNTGIGSSFDSASALGAGVSKTAAGFGGSTDIAGLTSSPNPAQIQTAVLDYIGFSGAMYTAWQGNSDRANYTLADFTACYDNTEAARSGGASTCNIDASVWATNSSELTYFAEAKTAVGTAGTVLTEAQLTNSGLTLPTTPSPLPLYARTYLSAQLSLRASATATSDWQEVLDYYNDETAARWFLGAAASANGSARLVSVGMPPSGTAASATIADIATSDASEAAFLAAGMSSSALSTTGATIADLQGSIRTSGLTASSTGTDYDNYAAIAAGFGTGTTFANVQTAVANGWTLANYELATNTPGNTWTTSQADGTAFADCLSSSDTLTGGSATCSVASSVWNSISSVASASSPSDLTDDDLENVIAAAGVTNAAFTDLDNLADYEADLIRDCMGTTVSTQNIQSCVSSATTETVNTQKVSGMIAGTYSGTPTVTDFQNAGIGTFDTATGDENVITFLNLNVCGSEGTSSCSIALGSAYTDASLVSAAGSSTTTKTALLNYLQDALADYTESMGNSIVGSTSDTGNSCGNVRIRAPFVCNGNPLFTCTALDGFSLTSDNRWIEKSVSAVSGVVSGRVTYTRRPWWGRAAWSRTVSQSVTVSHTAGGTFEAYTVGNPEHRRCEATSTCFDGGGVIVAEDNLRGNWSWPSSGYSMTAPDGGTNLDRAAFNALSTGTRHGYGYQVNYQGNVYRVSNLNAEFGVEDVPNYLRFGDCTNSKMVLQGNFWCMTPSCP